MKVLRTPKSDKIDGTKHFYECSSKLGLDVTECRPAVLFDSDSILTRACEAGEVVFDPQERLSQTRTNDIGDD